MAKRLTTTVLAVSVKEQSDEAYEEVMANTTIEQAEAILAQYMKDTVFTDSDEEPFVNVKLEVEDV